MKFESLALCEPLLRSLQNAGYKEATPIQQQAIPHILEGRDVIGCAQTGTGKTAAYVLPTLQQLMPYAAGGAGRQQRTGRRNIRALILAPTRELAGQIGGSLASYGRFIGSRHTVIYGGVRQGPQVRALQAGVDVLVATPGRLLDLVGQGFVKLGCVEILILDESDQMLDMGFIHDLRKIVAQVPDQRQTLMFSATMPPEIRELAGQWSRQPREVRVAPVASTPERVAQAVYFVERQHKAAVLSRFLRETDRSRTLVFSRTKRGADKIASGLQRDGIRAIAIHGDKSQARRQAVMREFNSPRPPVLVATDVAARGLDFADVSHVINYDLPEVPESYVHRIGRTARAGASGRAVSFCGRDERSRLRMIERLTGQAVSVEKLPAAWKNLQSQAAETSHAHRASTAEEANGQPHSVSTETTDRPFKQRSRRKQRSRPTASSKPASGLPQHTRAKTSSKKRKRARRAPVSC